MEQRGSGDPGEKPRRRPRLSWAKLSPAVESEQREHSPAPRAAGAVTSARADIPATVDSSFLDRVAERARAHRRVARRHAMVVVAVIVVLAAVAWAVFASPLLGLRTEDVTITGTGEGTTVATAQVAELVAQVEGVPLPRVDVTELVARLEAIDTVSSATVRREWPRGLHVTVIARVPVAAVAREDGLELLDAEAVVVGRVDERPDDLPLVDVPAGDRRTLAAVLDVVASLPSDLRAEVAQAEASNSEGVVLDLSDGTVVRWGSSADSELKARVLQVLRTEPASSYDVSVPRAPIAVE